MPKLPPQAQEVSGLRQAVEAGMPVIVAALAFVVYLITLAPGLTWAHEGADGGDLIAASYNLGIPHPTGYPLYMLVGKLFSFLPIGSVAYRFNFMSATWAALAVLFFCLWLRTWLPDAFPELPKPLLITVASTAGLLLAFSRLFWSQALIAEVYALNAFLMAAILHFVQQWEHAPPASRWRPLALGAFLFGLGLGNHLTLALALPPLCFYLFSARCRPTWREGLLSLGCLSAGLSIYLYLPLRAAAKPFPNWGDPTTPERFLWLVSGALYRRYVFALPLSFLPARLAKWAGDLVWQYGPWGVYLGLLGIWALKRESQRAFIYTTSVFALYSIYAIGYNTADSFVYLIPAYMIWAFWIARGLLGAIQWLTTSWLWLAHKKRAFIQAVLWILPLLSLAWNRSAVDLSQDREALNYLDTTLSSLPQRAIVISASDQHTFALWYAQQVEGRRKDVLVLDRDLLPYAWYRDSVFSRYPEVQVPKDNPDAFAWLTSFLDMNMPSSAIFLADPDERLLTYYLAEREGSLYRLTPRR